MATNAELLAEAKDAYHRLLLGESVVEVRDQSGESIRYRTANKADLAAYIQSLEATEAGVTRCRPLRFVW